MFGGLWGPDGKRYGIRRWGYGVVFHLRSTVLLIGLSVINVRIHQIEHYVDFGECFVAVLAVSDQPT